MEEAPTNPIWITLLCVARCVIPLIIMLGVTYLLKKLGLIAEPATPPAEEDNGNNQASGEGGMAHGKA